MLLNINDRKNCKKDVKSKNMNGVSGFTRIIA